MPSQAPVEQMPWMTPPSEGETTPPAEEPTEAEDSTKYVVPGLAEPSAEEEPDNSPWKNNPPAGPSVAQAAVAMPAAAPEGMNWGGFLLPFFWSIAHKAWIWMVVGLIASPIASIALLITGNKVAWNNRKFASVDEFRKVQKAWTMWGVIILVVSVVGTVVMWGTIAAMIFKQASEQMPTPGAGSFGAPSGYGMKAGPAMKGMKGASGPGGFGMKGGAAMKGAEGPVGMQNVPGGPGMRRKE
ncbi:MAG TPA: hypothetical protein VGK34_07930 [Armatimonadota bacterium]